MIEHYPPVTETEHYLETTSDTENQPSQVGAIIYLVNDSLFVARIRFEDSPEFEAEYPAKTLKIQSIGGQSLFVRDWERKEGWRWRIRLHYLCRDNYQGFYSAGKFVKFDLYYEVNFQHIFRSSLVWTVGYFRSVECDFEMRFAPKNKEEKGQEDGEG